MRPTAPSKTSTAVIRNRLTFFSIPAKRLGVAYSSCIAFSLADLAAADNYGCIVVTVLSTCECRLEHVTRQGDTLPHARTCPHLCATDIRHPARPPTVRKSLPDGLHDTWLQSTVS